jgi:tetratricopeptide (TPR) repeat protein
VTGGIRLAFFLLLAAAPAVAAEPAAARPLPPVEALAATPAERALLPRFMALASPAGAAQMDERLRAADALLAELPRPTALRGAVQLVRSNFLAAAGRDDEAIAAALEAIRLLPGYSAPHVNAGMIESYRDRPRQAVDHLIAGGAIDLEPIAGLSAFDVDSLVRRLDQQKEREPLARLAELLARAGWRKAPDTVARLAMARIETRLDSGDRSGAASLVAEVVTPEAFARILTERKFAPVRPAALALAGPRLEKLWPRYLAVAQSEWQSNAHDRVRRVYADALVAAGHDRSLIATFAPMFAGRIDPDDHSFLFAAVPVARAYARLGQWQRGYTLLDRVAAAFANRDVANRLNVDAARAMLLEQEGRLDEAAAAFAALIADSRRWAAEVGEHNLTAMHSHLACVLEQQGRGAQAAESWSFLRRRGAIDPVPLADALLCRDDLEGAREVLAGALAGEATRDAALDALQPASRGPYPSDHSRRDWQRWERLRSDPQMRAAAGRHAELLTERLNATAPPDPMLGRETPLP